MYNPEEGQQLEATIAEEKAHVQRCRDKVDDLSSHLAGAVCYSLYIPGTNQTCCLELRSDFRILVCIMLSNLLPQQATGCKVADEHRQACLHNMRNPAYMLPCQATKHAVLLVQDYVQVLRQVVQLSPDPWLVTTLQG